MLKLRLIVLEREARQVARTLGEMGVVHLKSSVEETGRRLDPEELDGELARCRALAERAGSLMELLGVATAAPSAGRKAGRLPQIGLEQAEDVIASLEQQAAVPSARLSEAQQALVETDEVIREVFPFRQVGSPLRALAESAFVGVKAGALDAGELEPLRAAMPAGAVIIPLGEPSEKGEPVDLPIVCPRQEGSAMETVLGQHGFVEKRLPGAADRGTFERVFGAPLKDLDSAPRDTALRRAIIAHCKAGKCWRGMGSLLFPQDLAWGAWGRQVYRSAHACA
jgi:hypothetical protein